MIRFGVDTYITLVEADTYVNTHYVFNDPLRIQWNEMSPDDKEVYIRKAFEQINMLPYTGRPEHPNQRFPFPRHGEKRWNEFDWDKIKTAQAAQALALSDTVAAQEVEDRIRLRRAGVVNYKIGDLSEHFQSGTPVDGNGNFFGLCETAYKYLSRWLQGGYKICTAIKPHFGIRWYLL